MANVKKSKNSCLVCDSLALKNITTGYSRSWPHLFKKIAACQDCGHIQLNPLYTPKEYEEINTKFFSKVYLVNGRSNVGNNDKKLEKLERFLGARLSSGLRVLDVGFQNYYDEQRSIFKAALKKNLFKDIRFFIKDILRIPFR